MNLNTYRVAARDRQSRRTLIILHGLGDSHEGWEWLPMELALPWLNHVLVDAPDDYFSGFSWFGLDLVDRSPPRILGDGVERSRRMIHALIDQEVAAGVPSAEVALLGFSQGCLMALESAFSYPAPLAGVVGISGWLDQPSRLVAGVSVPGRSLRALVTHGSHDPLLPIDWVRPQIKVLQEAGLDVVWQEFEKEHTVAGRAEVNFIRRFLESIYDMPAERSRGSGTAE